MRVCIDFHEMEINFVRTYLFTVQINKNFDQRVKLITFKHQSVIFMDKLKSAGFIIKESKHLTRSCCTKIFNYFPRIDLILIYEIF